MMTRPAPSPPSSPALSSGTPPAGGPAGGLFGIIAAWVSAFLAGFTRPSRLAFWIMVAVAGAMLALTLVFFSPAGVRGPLGAYLPRSDRHAGAFVTRDALQLEAAGGAVPRLVFMGSSTIGQVVGDGRDLAAALSMRTGVNWSPHVLTMPVQSPLEQIALIERITGNRSPDDAPMIILLGMGAHRFGWDPARLREFAATPRLGLRSDAADAELIRAGGQPAWRPGVPHLDNFAFYAASGTAALTRLMAQRPARRRVDVDSFGITRDNAAFARSTILDQINKIDSNGPRYLKMQGRIAALAQAAPGVHVVFVEESLSPGFIRDTGLGARQAEVLQRFQAFARGQDTEFWPVVAESGVTAADFMDDLHVRRGTPQMQIREILVARLTGLITARGMAP